MKKLSVLSLVIAIFLLVSIPVYAEEVGTITRVYGSETRAIDSKGFTEFYEGNHFVWFQMDTSIDAAKDFKALNQQALGDSTIKASVTNKLKLGGMTVKQINVSDGNPYSAMIAFEEANGKLRISIWLSWGGATVQSLFEKEVKEKFTVEILDGFYVPTKNYTISKPEYAKIKPVKYELSIKDLEFGQDKNNPKYTPDKDSWQRPLFEKLEAQWQLVGGADSTTTKKADGSNANTTKPAQTTNTSSNETGTTDNQETNTTVENGTIDTTIDGTESTATTSEKTGETGGDADKFNILPIILIVLGVGVIGAGVFLFLKQSKRKVD